MNEKSGVTMPGHRIQTKTPKEDRNKYKRKNEKEGKRNKIK